MGKSTVAAMFADAGVPVFDADAECAGCRAPAGGWSRRSRRAFPARTRDGAVDRDALAARGARRSATSSPRWKRSSIPRSHHARARFIADHGDAPALLFDIPLLFETGGEAAFDKVIVVSAPADVQRERVLARPGMTADKLDADPRAPNARRGQARARRLRHRHRGQPRRDPRPGGRDPRLSRPRRGRISGPCGKSSSTPRPPGSTRRAATAWSRSAASRCSTGSRPAATSTLISIPSGRCRARPRRCTGCRDIFLSDKPRFADKAEELLEFIGDSPLVAHNAGFDFGFLNHELQRCGRAAVCMSRMIDTLVLARTRHPGAKHSLDALCTRFGVDRSQRVKHGALLDAQLLAQVYVELTGGRQIGLGLVADATAPAASRSRPALARPIPRAARPHARVA